MKKIVLPILIVVLPLLVFSQNPTLQILNQKEIDVLNEQLQKSLKKCKCYSKKDTIQMFTVFRLFSKDTISKEEFIDGSFLRRLTHEFWFYYKNQPNISYSNYHKKDSTLFASHFIFSSKGKLIATSPEYIRRSNYRYLVPNLSRRFICSKKQDTSHFAELLKYVWGKEDVFIFRINEYVHPFYPYFIVNEQLEINVFYKTNSNNYEIVPIKEFIDNHWDIFSENRNIKLTR